MSFSGNITRVNSSVINSLISGRVDANAQVVGDKTGYSLTAGSYTVRASSTQFGTVSVSSGNASGTAAISSVTTTRAISPSGGNSQDSTPVDALTRHIISSSTQITGSRSNTPAVNNTHTYNVQELF